MPEGNWYRWGPDDEQGTLNLLTPEKVIRAITLVESGQVISLGQPLGPDTPVPPHRKRVERMMSRDGGDYLAGARRPGGFQFAEDVVSFASHSGTHIDALCHAWYGDQIYNGFPMSSIRSTSGAQKCGAHTLRPIVTRGVLLDVAGIRRRPLRAGEAIHLADLRKAAECMGVQPEPGDAILIRTGWLGDALRGEADFRGEPGIDSDAARWLAGFDVAIVGADNYAIEVVPSESGETFPVHQILIRDFGVPLIEGMHLDGLAEVAKGPFLFVAGPLALVGGTASPVAPMAVL